MFDQAATYLRQLPVEWFVLIGSFVEGVVSPLPMALVLIPAGAALAAQAGNPGHIVVLALLAGCGRVLGALILYWLAGRLQEAVYARRTSWLGVSRPTVERLRSRLDHPRAWWTLFSMWAIPIVPGGPISVMCGFVKMPLMTFVTATFAGSAVGSAFYLYLGYLGVNAVAAWEEYGLLGGVAGALLLAGAVVWLVRRSRAQSTPSD